MALSGGKTPVELYRRLAEAHETLPWDQTHLFLVDERFLPLNDQDSNYGMLRETLLTGISMPDENLHPIRTGTSDPMAAADQYEQELISFFKLSPGEFPRFDLILLGIGEEGHTASLFPRSPALNDCAHRVAAVILEDIRHHRVTLTLPVINHGENVLFLVTGKNKSTILRRIIGREDPSLPASRVNPRGGTLLFVIDREASVELGKEMITEIMVRK